MMTINRTTGQPISEREHIRQSIADILTTAIGSRVMRREYGSLIPELIDQPLNGATIVRLYAATASALMRWERRVRLDRVLLQIGGAAGSAVLDLTGTYVDSNEQLSLSVPLKLGASV